MQNVAPAPATAFELAPTELLAALRRLDGERGELVAVYHSHLAGGAGLSTRDLGRCAGRRRADPARGLPRWWWPWRGARLPDTGSPLGRVGLHGGRGLVSLSELLLGVNLP